MNRIDYIHHMINNLQTIGVTDPRAGDVSASDPSGRRQGAKARVLVVEDDRETLLWLAVLLRHAGYETMAAEDGAMAMTMAVKQQPDLIILDMGLPAGNGMFVLQSVRKHIDLCLTPVIVLTGGEDLDQATVLSAGATYFFKKPTENEVLLNAIEAALAV